MLTMSVLDLYNIFVRTIFLMNGSKISVGEGTLLSYLHKYARTRPGATLGRTVPIGVENSCPKGRMWPILVSLNYRA